MKIQRTTPRLIGFFIWIIFLVPLGLRAQDSPLTWESFLPLWMDSKHLNYPRFIMDQQRDRLLTVAKPKPQVSLSGPLGLRMSGLVRTLDPLNSFDFERVDQPRGSNNPDRSYLWGVSGGIGLVVDSLGLSGSVGAGLEASLFHVPQVDHWEIQLIPQIFGSLTIPTNWQQSRLVSQLNQGEREILESQSLELKLNQQIQGLNFFTQVGLIKNQLAWVDQFIPLVEGLAKLQQQAIETGNVTPGESFELNKELLSLNHQRAQLVQELDFIAMDLEINLPGPLDITVFPTLPPPLIPLIANQPDHADHADPNGLAHQEETDFVPQAKPGISQISNNQWELERQKIEINEKLLQAQSAPKFLVSFQAQVQLGQISWNGSVGIQPRKVFGVEKERSKGKSQELERVRMDQEKKEREIELERLRLEGELTGAIQRIGRVENWIKELEGLLDQYSRAREAKVIDELAYSKGKLELYQYQATLDQVHWEVWRLRMIKAMMGWD